MENTFTKIIPLDESLKFFYDDMTLMFGGFGGVGSPPTIIEGILQKGIKNLTLIGNDTGFPDIGIGKIVSSGRAKKVITSHIGSNPIAGKLMTEGKLEVEFSPQGILAERVRAGGVGLGGVLSDIGLDSEVVSQNKPKISLNGKTYILETALTADVSIVYAKKPIHMGILSMTKVHGIPIHLWPWPVK